GGLGRLPLGSRHAGRGAALHEAALFGIRYRGQPVRARGRRFPCARRPARVRPPRRYPVPAAHDGPVEIRVQRGTRPGRRAPGRVKEVEMAEIEANPVPTTNAHIVYLMHALAPFTLWTLAVVAVIVGAIARDHVRGTYVESHYSWLARTFGW